MSDQAVETERLRVQLKAIQNELSVNKDNDKNLASTKEHLSESEKDRKSLQDKIKKMADDFEKHSQKASDYLQSIIDENQKLRSDLEQAEHDKQGM